MTENDEKPDEDRDEKPSVNPEHNKPIHERPEARRTRLFRHHKAAGSVDLYYDLYASERPPEPETKKGRSRGR